MADQFSRTELLLGSKAMERLASSRVAVFGLGGVGGYVCEALVRSGVGAFDLIDSDRVSLSNLNRQIIATRKTLGRYKAEVMRERLLDINPEADVRVYKRFFLPDNSSDFPFGEYSYVVDAVDTVTAKTELVMKCREYGVPIISSMGTGNKLDGSRLRVADIYETRVCPLARVMRRELRKRGVESLKVVYSEEEPLKPVRGAGDAGTGRGGDDEPDFFEAGDAGGGANGFFEEGDAYPLEVDRVSTGKRSVPGSVAFVPSIAGLLIAGEVVRDLAL